MMVIDNQFELGDTVFLKTDPDQQKRIVTEIRLTLDGGVLYCVNFSDCSYIAYEKELTKEKDYASI